ncbi:MAG: DUF2304 domain-containing protein [Pirellulales bacterium]|nr:DUF2304 domain-containing protein [Pirellulales bacterium]
MLIVQWVLVPAAMVIATWEFAAFLRTASRLRLIHALAWSAVALTVWKPDLFQRLANALNIGRGADFLLYGLVVFTLVFSYYVLRQLELQRLQITGLVRELAIRSPLSVGEPVDGPADALNRVPLAGKELPEGDSGHAS